MNADVDLQPERASKLVVVGRQLRPVAPVLMVTAFAIYGQIGYGLEKYSRPETPFLLALVIAVGAAVTVESIASYVQWHAHDARLLGATATAARLRRASYLIALAVAGVNYSHFAGPGLAPTPGAIVFGLFSASQPWLWGLHTRRAQHKQLLREGHADSAGAVFSAERFRAFPLRTIAARRWSIDYGVTDPRQAWEGYRKDKAARAGAPTAEQQLALLVAVGRLAATKPATAPKPRVQRDDTPKPAKAEPVDAATAPAAPPAPLPEVDDRVLDLIASGVGHVRLQRELDVSEYQARQMLKKFRTNGHKVTTS